MVRVAVAGGSGNVASEVIDKILQRKKHEVTVLTQKPPPSPPVDQRGVRWLQVDYSDKYSLADILRGIDVVLCFFSGSNPYGVVRNQKNLIDASIQAGVKRFAPSEWACRDNRSIPHYAFKNEIREYLDEANSGRILTGSNKRLEYTLFQPGLLTNYFGYPHSTSIHLSMTPWFVDFENRRAIIVGDGNYPLSLTTVQDLGEVVATALDHKGTWPIDGGCRGTQMTVAELIELGRKLRGSMTVESVSMEDLRVGKLKTTWFPLLNHPGVPEEYKEIVSRNVMISFVRSAAERSWSVSDEWNRLLPHYRFTAAEDYLREVWEGKP
ncbi:hypothetical protein BKCO1_1000043 [Neofusicoccum parvum]|uniref:Uncharacterized protein n=1 Tax=Neofusicoccum parvum TaxID=310453 RepID=A0ACB5RT37_9PEZI|nr:hypothetical protein BKCO1_1000043 [Neofusicoccum parvum]